MPYPYPYPNLSYPTPYPYPYPTPHQVLELRLTDPCGKPVGVPDTTNEADFKPSIGTELSVRIPMSAHQALTED